MSNLLVAPEVTWYCTRNVDEARELGFFKFEYVYAVFDIENRETYFEDRVVYCVDHAYMMNLLNSWNCSSKKIFSDLKIFPKFIYKYYLNPSYVPVKMEVL